MKDHPGDAEAEREKQRQQQKAYRDRVREKAREKARVTEQGRHPGAPVFKMDSGGEASSLVSDVSLSEAPAPSAEDVVTRSVQETPEGASGASLSSTCCSVCHVRGQIRWIIPSHMGMRHGDREPFAGWNDP